MNQDTDPRVATSPEAAAAEAPAVKPKPKPSAKPTAARTAIQRTPKPPASPTRTESNRPYDADYCSGHRVWPGRPERTRPPRPPAGSGLMPSIPPILLPGVMHLLYL